MLFVRRAPYSNIPGPEAAAVAVVWLGGRGLVRALGLVAPRTWAGSVTVCGAGDDGADGVHVMPSSWLKSS